MRIFLIALLCVAVSAAAIAEEPRWCSVSIRDPSNTLTYAPIAVAARVQGEVQARIVYKPNGRVEKVEQVSGAAILSGTFTDQLSHWIVRSNAIGDELCQTIVIVTFQLRKPARRWSKQKTKFILGPNAIHVSVSKHEPEIEESEALVAVRQGL